MHAMLPALREELALLPGPVLADGQPSWTLHDPVRGQFFRIDWLTFEILARWSLGHRTLIAESIATATTLQAQPTDVDQVVKFVTENQLVSLLGVDSAERLSAAAAKGRLGVLQWLLHHYLFFRVPLWRPDAWLGRWQHVAGFFYRPAFLGWTVAALVAGVIQVVRHADTFLTTLVNTFTPAGFLGYGVALIFVKVLHELGHAFTAKRHGCRIPAMGVAFLVLWPMAYTDTNEVWRLTSRWQRLQVAAAGIMTELIVGIWALLAWGLLPDGELRGLAFVLCTTSLVATLTINASPFMRFDGYFIACDLLDLPNLHARSFALARWKLREWIFELRQPPPEQFSPRRQRALILFAWGTWLYRLVVFLGIAVLVYHFFIKAVGILLFAVEIGWFIVLPVWREVKEWRTLARAGVAAPGARRPRPWRWKLALFGGLILLAFLPWPGRVTATALLRPAVIWPLHVPGAAALTENQMAEGRPVTAGSPLARLQPTELPAKAKLAALRLEQARWAAFSAGSEPGSRAGRLVAEEEAAAAEKQVQALDLELQRYAPSAPGNGVIRDTAPDLRVGEWLPADERLAHVVGRDRAMVETYLDEEQVRQIRPGQRGVFLTQGREGPVIEVEVVAIDADATRMLPDGRLAATTGGHILARERQQQVVPEFAVYRVVLAVKSPWQELQAHIWRGDVTIRTDATSRLTRYVRHAVMVLLRETGF
jgi:putative peptide zinc metalloprotease protein